MLIKHKNNNNNYNNKLNQEKKTIQTDIINVDMNDKPKSSLALSKLTLQSLNSHNTTEHNYVANTIIGQEILKFDYKHDLAHITKSKLKCIKENTLNNKYYQELKQKSLNASKNNHIFTLLNCSPVIKESLLKRGWIQKYTHDNCQYLQRMSDDWLLAHAKPNNLYESILMSKFLKKSNVNFYWTPRQYKINQQFNNNNVKPYRNSIYHSKNYDFTNKDGLLSCIELSKLNQLNGIKEIMTPRCYRLSKTDECKEFLKDYRITCCLNLLKFINDTDDTKHLICTYGQISTDIIKFAEQRILKEINKRNKYKLLKKFTIIDDSFIENHEWDKFCLLFDRLLTGRDKFKLIKSFDMDKCKVNCKTILQIAKYYWNTFDSEGFKNLWILKPSFCSQGRGIVIKTTYRDIEQFFSNDNRNKKQYIVQKYIEKPLLIYNTKFDIRQYILLTITNNNLNIWMYKNCYLRFSSQEYQLNELNKSIHLTNNSIQKKLINGERNKELPNSNMWSLKQFKIYLKKQHQLKKWSNKIYPSMKNNIINIILSSLKYTKFVNNSFCLYGADFLLDYNYDTILLEINSTPDLSPSTIITGKICPAMLKDLIKVVIDLPINNLSKTGNFELIQTLQYEKRNENVIMTSTEKKILKNKTS